MDWELQVKQKFEQMIGKIPVFLKGVAEKKVWAKAESLAQQEGRSTVSEKDMVDAFFAATPFGFHGPMKADMEEFHIDYTKYGHSK